MWRDAVSTVRRALLIAVGALASVAPLAAQSVPEGRVLDRLAGEWVGTGELLGRSASFSMTWTAESEGYYGLDFRNAFVTADGAETPVLHARAVYRLDPSGDTALGVWIDDRPQRITLDAVVTDSTVATEWTAPTERGRTEYLASATGEVVVRDWVQVDGAWRPFGEARYRRR